MAYLYYGPEILPVEMPDRVLAHVKVVIATKLRRNESFMLTWRHPGDDGVTSIWLQPSIPLRFVFDVAEAGELDGEYLQTLARAANSSRGLVLEWEDSAETSALQREVIAA
jgi:hypothetical protein